MKRIELAIAIGLLCTILLTSFTGFAQQCEEIREEVVRLHILANSDSAQDQRLKLAVRDAILEQTEEFFRQSQSKEQAEALAEQHIEEIRAIAKREIVRQGYDYDVTARIINRYFETRVYDGFTMPAGYYDALQLEIGSGEGKNWWCVMFPPMCIPAATADSGMELEDKIRNLGETPQYQPAFAVVEVIESIHQYFAED